MRCSFYLLDRFDSVMLDALKGSTGSSTIKFVTFLLQWYFIIRVLKGSKNTHTKKIISEKLLLFDSCFTLLLSNFHNFTTPPFHPMPLSTRIFNTLHILLQIMLPRMGICCIYLLSFIQFTIKLNLIAIVFHGFCFGHNRFQYHQIVVCASTRMMKKKLTKKA